MASPTIESLCCLSTHSHSILHFLYDFQTLTYNGVSFAAALLGIAGALYQILTKQNIPHRRNSIRIRSSFIIKWLTLADLMAAIGILVRSFTWLVDRTLASVALSDVTSQVFCVLINCWIHYFYTATYIWTLLYGIDVKVALEGRPQSKLLYHCYGWTCPAVLCLGGLLLLYLPDLNCHSHSVNPYIRFLPNYLSTFVPILLVMVINPVLYFMAFSQVENLVATAHGRYTNHERRLVQMLKLKFFCINAVFYLCWLPNVINGIFLWVPWDSVQKTVIIAVWYFMAILNPMQAVFNCLVYQSWESETHIKPTCLWCRHCVTHHHHHQDMDDAEIENYSVESRSSENSIWKQFVMWGKNNTEKLPLLLPQNTNEI